MLSDVQVLSPGVQLQPGSSQDTDRTAFWGCDQTACWQQRLSMRTQGPSKAYGKLLQDLMVHLPRRQYQVCLDASDRLKILPVPN